MADSASAACGCSCNEGKAPSGSSPRFPHFTQWAVLAAGLLTGLGLFLEFVWLGERFFAMVAYGLAILSGGSLIAPQAARSLRRGRFDMNVLMTIAVAGAVAIGEWSEGAAVVFLFALSEWLEGLSFTRARRAVGELMKLAPDTALLKDGEGEENSPREVPVDTVQPGSTLVVRSGSRVPLDGVVLTGHSTLDQSPITGESVPVAKAPGDELFAGSINGDGLLEMRVARSSGESTLARIVHLVEEAQASRAPTQRFVDRFAQVYTPTVVVLAALLAVVPPLFTGAWGDWFYRSLVLLVIACPCALVIATPISIISGLTAMARRGVLVKGGAALEAVGSLSALAVDKTGTITSGTPSVVGVYPISSTGDHTGADLLRIAAAIDRHSTHPLALAVVAAAEQRGLAIPPSTGYRSTGGRGADALVEGHPCFVGNHHFAHEAGVCTPEVEARLATIEAQAQSVVIIGHRPHPDPNDSEQECPGRVLGILAIADTLRPEVPEALAALHTLGIRPVVMLSGDNQRTASAIAASAGIDHAYGDLLPRDKIAKMEELLARHGRVGMVGDGINDAPALAAASVGIAMGQGTDTALETADIALLNNDLRNVAQVIRLGRRTLRMIQGNIAFALGIKLVFLLLAALGYATLWMAIVADTGATLLVIANAFRLLQSPTTVSSP